MAGLERALATEPKCVRAFALRAVVRLDTHGPTAARADVAAALDVNPESGQALVVRAGLRTHQGRETHAVEDLERVAALAPDDPLAPILRGARDLVRKRFAEVIRVCDEMERVPGGNIPELYLLHSRCHLLRGAPADAIADCDRLLAARANEISALVTRSFANDQRGDRVAAATDTDRALAIDPPEVYRERAALALGMRDFGS